MKIRPLNRAEVRRVDEVAINEFEMTGLMLMENAGAGAARIVDQVSPSGRIAILCGKGNNAGDGFVIARHLELIGRDVSLICLFEPSELQGDAAVNCNVAIRSDLNINVVRSADELATLLNDCSTVVDCLLGTGATGELRGLFAAAVTAANESDATRIAIDIPTGLDCDTGQVAGDAFCADHTVTFVTEKLGLLADDAAPYVGQIHVVSIGVPAKLLKRFDA